MPVAELDRIMAQIEAKLPCGSGAAEGWGPNPRKFSNSKTSGNTSNTWWTAGPVACLDLPFWAKVWEASFVLAYFLGRQPVVPGRRILEIGAGIGVVGHPCRSVRPRCHHYRQQRRRPALCARQRPAQRLPAGPHPQPRLVHPGPG